MSELSNLPANVVSNLTAGPDFHLCIYFPGHPRLGRCSVHVLNI